jgi:hypothetical protein
MNHTLDAYLFLEKIKSNKIENLNMNKRMCVCHGFIEDLSDAIENNKSIKVADLSDNQSAFYYPEERQYLLNKLRKNKSIKNLNLSYNKIGWYHENDIMVLCELIKNNNTIQELNLKGNYIYDVYSATGTKHEEMFLEAIMQNDTIISINVNFTGMNLEYKNKVLLKVENNRKLRPLTEQVARFIKTNNVHVPEWFPKILLDV